MYINLTSVKHERNAEIATTCPHCGHKGTFDLLSKDTSVMDESSGGLRYMLGLRRCPNRTCRGYLFFVVDSHGALRESYPPQVTSFNKEDIPESVLRPFEEVVTCHANKCYLAAAIMIRKTLEEICQEQGVLEGTLKKKIKAIGEKILIPKELIEGMDELRLLGNDAAHVEARAFNEIGIEEIEVSIEFTLEFLKAMYQLESLVKKLKQLKVSKAQSDNKENA